MSRSQHIQFNFVFYTDSFEILNRKPSKKMGGWLQKKSMDSGREEAARNSTRLIRTGKSEEIMIMKDECLVV